MQVSLQDGSSSKDLGAQGLRVPPWAIRPLKFPIRTLLRVD